MNHDNPELPTPVELPQPQQSAEMPMPGAEAIKSQGSERNPEFIPSQPIKSPAPQSHTSTPQNPGSHSPTNNSGLNNVVGTSPQIADDVDLIEKEWVEKAKEIVEKTKDNPYLQNKAISQIKSDYIKKRYNKDLAKSDE